MKFNSLILLVASVTAIKVRDDAATNVLPPTGEPALPETQPEREARKWKAHAEKVLEHQENVVKRNYDSWKAGHEANKAYADKFAEGHAERTADHNAIIHPHNDRMKAIDNQAKNGWTDN